VTNHGIDDQDSIPIRKYVVCIGYNKVVLGQTTEEFWFDYRQGQKIFYSPNCLGPTLLPIHSVPAAVSPGVKRSGSKTDHWRSSMIWYI